MKRPRRQTTNQSRHFPPHHPPIKPRQHGNRSVSSMCGSADVLEALGVAVDLGPDGVARCVEDVGMGFMFAPRYHPSMKAVAPVRKALKVRTAFNLLGPMLNPADSKYALVGVYTPELQVRSIRTCFTHRPVSTLDRVPFQLTDDEHLTSPPRRRVRPVHVRGFRAPRRRRRSVLPVEFRRHRVRGRPGGEAVARRRVQLRDASVSAVVLAAAVRRARGGDGR